jgi:hypothetical protein
MSDPDYVEQELDKSRANDAIRDDPAFIFLMQRVIHDLEWDNDRVNGFGNNLAKAPLEQILKISRELGFDDGTSSLSDYDPDPTPEPVTCEPEPSEHTDENEFAIVEHYGIDHPECGVVEIGIYTLCCRHAHFPKKTTSLSIKGAAARLGITWRAARDGFGKLNRLGLLKAVGRTPEGATIHQLPHRYRPAKKTKKTRH